MIYVKLISYMALFTPLQAAYDFKRKVTARVSELVFRYTLCTQLNGGMIMLS